MFDRKPWEKTVWSSGAGHGITTHRRGSEHGPFRKLMDFCMERCSKLSNCFREKEEERGGERGVGLKYEQVQSCR